MSSVGNLIVKCLENNGVGDCHYRPFCVARIMDRTITGCNMPFIWMGMLDKSKAVVEHTMKVRKEE